MGWGWVKKTGFFSQTGMCTAHCACVHLTENMNSFKCVCTSIVAKQC